jgi:RNA polymerase sigma factor (sigma-70 family)
MSECIRWWLDQAGRFPLLTPQQELTLGRQIQAWQESPSPLTERRGRRARDRLVNANLRLVVVVARRYSNHVGAAIGLGDLIQGGNLGLIRAAEKFDPTRGYRFTTYAYWWIQQGIAAVVDRDSRTIRMPTTFAPKLHALGRASQQLVGKLGREPTRAELAEALGMRREDLDAVLVIGSRPVSLDELVRCDGDTPRGELLAAPEEPAEDPETLELRRRVAGLSPQLQRLVAGHYGLGTARQGLKALARSEGLSLAQARRLLAVALRQLNPPEQAPPTPEAFEAGEQLLLISETPARPETMPAPTPDGAPRVCGRRASRRGARRCTPVLQCVLLPD